MNEMEMFEAIKNGTMSYSEFSSEMENIDAKAYQSGYADGESAGWELGHQEGINEAAE